MDSYESRSFAKMSWISLGYFGCGNILYGSPKQLPRRADSGASARIGAPSNTLILRAFVLSG
jgi:hypothetical protein